MNISDDVVTQITQVVYEKFNEGLIGCCEPHWTECDESFKHRLEYSIRKGLECLGRLERVDSAITRQLSLSIMENAKLQLRIQDLERKCHELSSRDNKTSE